MRAFLALSCVVTLASARPDVSLGYRYPQPGGGSDGGFDSGSLIAPGFGGSSGGGGSGGYAPSFSSGSIGAPSFSSGGSFGGGGFGSGGGGSFGGGSFGGGSFGGGSFGGGHSQHDQTPIVTKHFYVHSAPEEHGETVQKHFTLGRPQKHYRVVFIKAPAEGGAAARLSASYAPQEEKTVIYVLSKKADALQVSDIATPAPIEPSKPEVFFIKYKTEQEAHHAQQQIQSQYDSLGGSSQVSDEGVAPVSSVIGALGGGGSAGGGHIGGGSGIITGGGGSSTGLISGSGSGGTYLPPSR